MSMNNRTGIEAIIAIASIAVGITGAALVEPIILGVAAAGAVTATAMRLTDRANNPNSLTPKGEKVKIA